jgi:hypothetical protein
MRHLLPATRTCVAVATFILGANAAAARLAADALVHVRPATPAARTLIDDAVRHSPTVRALIDQVDRTDVIVYVQLTASSQVASAATTFVATTVGRRYLRVLIHAGVPAWNRTELLAHELHHVLEIAAEPGVTSNDGIRSLYDRIGHSSGKDRFETEAARRIEDKVRNEIVQARR